MELTAIHHPIAERELQHSDGRIIRVVIGRPEPFPGDESFFCPFRIIGLAGDKVRYAGGTDAVQALTLAQRMIGALLYTSDAYRAGQLTWEGGSVYGDLGFPVPDNLRDLPPKGAAYF